MGFLEKFNNRTKGNVALLITTAIGIYLATLVFININYRVGDIGRLLVLVGVIIITIIAEQRREQLLPVVILLLMNRFFHIQFSEGVSQFYIRLVNGTSFQWNHIIDLIISLYLWIKLIALLVVERKASYRIQARWIPLVLSLFVYGYLTTGTINAIYFVLPIFVGFIVKQERLTLIYILVLFIRPFYESIYNVINFPITTNSIIQLGFAILFAYFIYRNLQSLDNDNYLN